MYVLYSIVFSKKTQVAESPHHGIQSMKQPKWLKGGDSAMRPPLDLATLDPQYVLREVCQALRLRYTWQLIELFPLKDRRHLAAALEEILRGGTLNRPATFALMREVRDAISRNGMLPNLGPMVTDRILQCMMLHSSRGMLTWMVRAGWVEATSSGLSLLEKRDAERRQRELAGKQRGRAAILAQRAAKSDKKVLTGHQSNGAGHGGNGAA